MFLYNCEKNHIFILLNVLTMKKIIFLLFTLLFSIVSYCQQNETLLIHKVLKKSVINKTYTYGKWEQRKGNHENAFTYLGIITNDTETYKIINSTLTSGISGRETRKVFIYNSENKLIGNYQIEGELPTKIEENKLFFNIDIPNCSRENGVSFSLGIPNTLSLNCNNISYYIGTFEKN